MVIGKSVQNNKSKSKIKQERSKLGIGSGAM